MTRDENDGACDVMESSKMLELRTLGLHFEMRKCGGLVESAPAHCVRIVSLDA